VNHFCFHLCFRDSLTFMPRANLGRQFSYLPTASCIAGMTAAYHYTWLVLLRLSLTNSLPESLWNNDPPHFHLLSSWDYKCGPTMTSPCFFPWFIVFIFVYWVNLKLCLLGNCTKGFIMILVITYNVLWSNSPYLCYSFLSTLPLEVSGQATCFFDWIVFFSNIYSRCLYFVGASVFSEVSVTTLFSCCGFLFHRE
jgi:hypothetical protein